MDDGSTYVSKSDKGFTVEFSTHVPEEEAN
jgi:hypothetical protein|uniref:Uncharacterized protein n=1 Tax=Podoviridae sp. ct8Lf7 TaxID=2827723 RepID=A0A8S5S0C1_9CAUD|nr:MAG TPA: hypothetical protein [Podoviridae sp. ct8Lf7]